MLSAINKDKISWIESWPRKWGRVRKTKNNSFLSNLSLSLPLHVKYYWKERKIGTESNIKGVSNKAETCWLEGQSVTNCNPFSLQLWSRPLGENIAKIHDGKNTIQIAHLCFNYFHVAYFLLCIMKSLSNFGMYRGSIIKAGLSIK